MTDTQTIAYKRIAELEDENAKLRAQIDNLQAPRPAPTIGEILGPHAFERMMELRPSFRESGTPTRETDTATEVLWSAIRFATRIEAQLTHAEDELERASFEISIRKTEMDRMRAALAEYAMRAVEEVEL
jgi:hypothetical protein